MSNSKKTLENEVLAALMRGDGDKAKELIDGDLLKRKQKKEV